MNPSGGLEEVVDASLSNLYDDGKNTAGILIINLSTIGTSHATNTSEEGGRISLEEKKKRKKIADKKHRDKCKAYLKVTEENFQSAMEKVKVLESANNSLKEERNSMAQELLNSTIQVGQLKSAIKRMDETIVVQQQRIAFLCRNQDGKMEEELQRLETENCQLKCMNQNLMAENDTMAKNLQTITLNIEQLQSQIYTLNSIITQQQQQLLNNVPVEEEQLWQEVNGSLGFVLDGGPIATSVSEIQPMMDSEMSQLVEKLKREAEEARNNDHEKWMREVEEARNDRAETKKQLDEVHAEMRAIKATMFKYMKSRNF